MRRVWKWALVGWSALMLVWLFSSVPSESTCDGGTPWLEACRDGEAVGAGVAVIVVLFVWTLGAVLLGIAWRVSGPSEPPAPAGPAAGWYEDPHGQHRMRWWDGSMWTDRVR